MNIEVDGYNIFYKVTGEGEQTAVILQGWGTNCEIYDSVANTINDTYRVIQFDLPGFGASDEPREPWSVDDYADFFCKFMETLGIGRAVLIGHSYGGRMIIKLAARKDCGFEIARIVLIDSAGIMPKRSFKKRMKIKKYKVLKKLFNIKLVYALFPELIDAWRSQQGSEDYKNATPMMRQCMVMAVNEDLEHLLPKMKQDTLLIWGDRDTATPIADGRAMEEKIPNAGLAVIQGAGHFSFLDNPGVFRNIMRVYFQIGVKDGN